MKRGEVWTVSSTGYAGKPRPALIVQADRFNATASVTICAFTTDETEADVLRILVTPSESNGLRSVSRLMVDKIITVSRERLGQRIGYLSTADMVRLNRSILAFLGLN